MKNLRAADHKIVCFTTWRPDHNNVRYATLFPKLESVVTFHTLHFSSVRILRAIQSRIWNATNNRVINPIVLRYLSKKYKTLFTPDSNQIEFWHSSIVVDLDDPQYTEKEFELVNLPRVRAIVVTTPRSKEAFEKRGITRPIYVIPQGVSFNLLDATKVEQIAKAIKKTKFVVGFVAPRLTISTEGANRAKQGINDVDELVAAVERAREINSQVVLWLIGTPSKALEKYAIDKEWIRLLGYIPSNEVLNYICNLDVATYPRTHTFVPGQFSIKIAQYMACGVPIVAMNVDEALMVGEIGAGLVCGSAVEFTEALGELVRSEGLRRQFGETGRAYAREFLDWDKLIVEYERILAPD